MMRGAFPLRFWFLLLAFLVPLVCLPVAAAFADDPKTVAIRLGTHSNFGRVVFDLPATGGYHLTQDGDHVAIEFDNNANVTTAPRGTRNVLSVTGGNGRAELVVAPGTSLRAQQYGNHVVIDVMDAGVGGAVPSRPVRATTAASPPVPPAPKPPAQAAQPPAPVKPTPPTQPPPKPADPVPSPP